jgi:hypothetical protein
VSIQLGVDCVDCRLMAPHLGGGYLGEPSVETSRDDEAESALTFAYFYEALEGIGLRPFALVQVWEFLLAHKGHRMQVSDGEGMAGDTRTIDEMCDEEDRRIQSGEFGNCVYGVACKDCDATLRAPWAELMGRFRPFKPSPEAVATFIRRWDRNPDEGWNHNLGGIIDPYAFLGEVLDFFKTHEGHHLQVRLHEAKERVV